MPGDTSQFGSAPLLAYDAIALESLEIIYLSGMPDSTG